MHFKAMAYTHTHTHTRKLQHNTSSCWTQTLWSFQWMFNSHEPGQRILQDKVSWQPVSTCSTEMPLWISNHDLGHILECQRCWSGPGWRIACDPALCNGARFGGVAAVSSCTAAGRGVVGMKGGWSYCRTRKFQTQRWYISSCYSRKNLHRSSVEENMFSMISLQAI